MSKRKPAREYIEGILMGDRILLSQAITVIESKLESDRVLAEEILTGCQDNPNESFRIGITGVPGVGKSTFIDTFGTFLTGKGHKVAVLAVDPSSGITHGSILGDKTRMERLAKDPLAYIRPSPAGGSLGGVTRTTRECILLCEAAGFDYILIETVGVGQSETAVRSMVDFFLLLMLAGAGDELQGIKKGIMEMADTVAINKADGANLAFAKQARNEYQKALHLFQKNESGWYPKVTTCSALEESGIEDIFGIMNEFQEMMTGSGWLDKQRKAQAVNWMKETVLHLLEERFLGNENVKEGLERLSKEVGNGEKPPTVAANELMRIYLQTGK